MEEHILPCNFVASSLVTLKMQWQMKRDTINEKVLHVTMRLSAPSAVFLLVSLSSTISCRHVITNGSRWMVVDSDSYLQYNR